MFQSEICVFKQKLKWSFEDPIDVAAVNPKFWSWTVQDATTKSCPIEVHRSRTDERVRAVQIEEYPKWHKASKAQLPTALVSFQRTRLRETSARQPDARGEAEGGSQIVWSDGLIEFQVKSAGAHADVCRRSGKRLKTMRSRRWCLMDSSSQFP